MDQTGTDSPGPSRESLPVTSEPFEPEPVKLRHKPRMFLSSTTGKLTVAVVVLGLGYLLGVGYLIAGNSEKDSTAAVASADIYVDPGQTGLPEPAPRQTKKSPSPTEAEASPSESKKKVAETVTATATTTKKATATTTVTARPSATVTQRVTPPAGSKKTVTATATVTVTARATLGGTGDTPGQSVKP